MDNMGDRAGRTARRAACVENVVLEDADLDAELSSGNESLKEVVRAPLGRARPPAVVAPLAMDPGMCLNMVNVKPPYLVDLELDSMMKFILEYKRYSQNSQDNF